MKLRIQGNSLRLRISPEEVEKLRQNTRIKQQVRFHINPESWLHYELMFSENTLNIEAHFQNNRISVIIPAEEAKEWLNSDKEGMSARQDVNGESLSILIEKDRFE